MIKGVVAGAFDILHPGYIHLFSESKKHCDHLTVLLHIDPSIENPNKLKPILSISERILTLNSIRFIDDIQVYLLERDLLKLLPNFNVRFLGTDYLNTNFTGKELNLPIVYIDRSHGWSTTKLKEMLSK